MLVISAADEHPSSQQVEEGYCQKRRDELEEAYSLFSISIGYVCVNVYTHTAHARVYINTCDTVVKILTLLQGL